MEGGRGRGRGRRSAELEAAVAEYRRVQRESARGSEQQQGSVSGVTVSPEARAGRSRGFPIRSSGFDSVEPMGNSSSGSSGTPGISPSPVHSESPSEIPSSPSSPSSPPSRAIFRGVGRGRLPAQFTSSSESNSPTPATTIGTLREPESIFQDIPDEDSPMSEEDELVAQYRRMNVPSTSSGRVMGMGRGRGIVTPVPVPEQRLPLNVARGRGRGRASIFETMPIGLPRTQEGSRDSSAHASHSHSSSNSEVGVEDYSVQSEAVVCRRGEKGTMIPVTANYIRLGVKKNSGMYEYHVDFDPFLESFRFRRAVMKQLEEAGYISRTRNFDGAKLFLPYRLPRKVTCLNAELNGETVMVTIKFVKENRMGDSVHFYNILFRRIMEQLGLLEVNRSFYDYRTSFKLPQHRLEIWPGYVTAIDEAEGGLLLCVDASHRVLRTITLHQVLQEMDVKFGSDYHTLQSRFGDYALGQIVLTRYNNKHYKIHDIDWNLTPKDTYKKKTGEEISYFDYYQEQYGITIKDLCQPLLIHRPKESLVPGRRQPLPGIVCLVPELCFLTGLSEDITGNYGIMKDIGDHTRLSPEARNLALLQFVKKVKGNPNALEMLDSWGLSLEDATLELQGRILMAPAMTLNQHLTIPGSSDFGRETTKNQCFDAIPVHTWVVFCLTNDREKARNLLINYRNCCRNVGIQVTGDGLIHAIQPSRGNRLKEDFQKALIEYLKKRNLQFIVVIVPRQLDDLYGLIKHISCVEYPIPCQVILSSTLNESKKLRTIVCKIALQINCKMGGSLWTIKIPLDELIMFVGIDVYHDPKGKSASVTALVATISANHTKYYSRIVKQAVHQETIDALRNVFFDALVAFKNECGGRWPDRILVFRDGVGDGQLETTKQHEVVQFTSTFQKFCDNQPKFTYTVVQKRINCRVFSHDERTGRLVNPMPGTILDHTVTRKKYFDFFLVSQLVRQGTVSPTHFIVLEDNSDIKPDLIQRFAFAASYMYYNWAGPIRVPAVTQLAHKLSFLTGQYIKDDPSTALSTKLFYL